MFELKSEVLGQPETQLHIPDIKNVKDQLLVSRNKILLSPLHKNFNNKIKKGFVLNIFVPNVYQEELIAEIPCYSTNRRTYVKLLEANE